MSNMAMAASLLKRMDAAMHEVHGFLFNIPRLAGEKTSFAVRTCEIGSCTHDDSPITEPGYRRGNALKAAEDG